MGGAVAAVENGYMKSRLVESNARRRRGDRARRADRGRRQPFHRDRASPLAAGDGAILRCRPEVEAEQIARLAQWRAARDAKAVAAALAELRARRAIEARNIMPASIACAKAGVTTGEWGEALREGFGEYRAPTGVVADAARNDCQGIDDLRAEVERVSPKLGRRPKILVGKPGLDGHSNGAEQIAVRARDAGMEVVYDGIRLTPGRDRRRGARQGVHVVGLSILSGSHMPLVKDVVARLRDAGLDGVPVVVGGIIPPDDAAELMESGVAAVYTPKDFELNQVMSDVLRIVARSKEAR